jgi:RNA polymerase sigma factor (TIGR02999 family)
MSEVTRILTALEQGDPAAAEQLLPLVYAELRRLAAQKLAREPGGQTLQATALVHEAYLRLVGNDATASWDGRGHFFAAAAEAMRLILIENARRKGRQRRGGGRRRVDMPDAPAPAAPLDDVLAVDEALTQLAQEDAATAELVKLHYFAGLSLEEAASLLEISPRTAYRHWSYARAWLFRRLGGDCTE